MHFLSLITRAVKQNVAVNFGQLINSASETAPNKHGRLSAFSHQIFTNSAPGSPSLGLSFPSSSLSHDYFLSIFVSMFPMSLLWPTSVISETSYWPLFPPHSSFLMILLLLSLSWSYALNSVCTCILASQTAFLASPFPPPFLMIPLSLSLHCILVVASVISTLTQRLALLLPS